MRVFLTVILPLLAPLAIYIAYMLLVERRRLDAAGSGNAPSWWIGIPWVRLVAAGVGLAATVAALLALTGGQEPGDTYHPARIEDGEVVRGRPQR